MVSDRFYTVTLKFLFGFLADHCGNLLQSLDWRGI
jgi:hypothetical protein